MSKRVLVHVGTPKTGTSHLQDVLHRNRERLATHGLLYPAERFDEHFLAALDLMKLTWGGLELQAVGAWDRLAADVRAWPGTSVVSHEILATASRTQVDRALTSLGADDGAQIHLILSVRDLVRQIPAEWQENVKHRSVITYERFLEVITDPERDSRIGTWFWGVQEIPDIVNRWGATIPPERIHLVTVPAPGAPRDELWRRFSLAFGLEGLDLDLTPERANPSLGVPETALLRRDQPQGRQGRRPGRLPPAGARAARPPDAVGARPVVPAGAAAAPAHLGAGGLADLGRRHREAGVRRHRRPRRPDRSAAAHHLRRPRPPRRGRGRVGGARLDQGAARGDHTPPPGRGRPQSRARRHPVAA